MKLVFHKRERVVISRREASEFSQANYFRARNERPLIKISQTLVYKVKMTLPGWKASANDTWLFRAVMDSPKIRKISEKNDETEHKSLPIYLTSTALGFVLGVFATRLLLPPSIKQTMAEIILFPISLGKLPHLDEESIKQFSEVMGGALGCVLDMAINTIYWAIYSKRFARSLQAEIKEVLTENAQKI
ncbi:MAG: hypothetical protein NTX79_00970 [Candidatus Micrarchaeota archaeon]|nr:hypothetical protein [Candidatus Micrarchaeota archaeon]